MAVPFECYDCILGSLSGLVLRATEDREEQLKLIKEFIRVVADADEDATPPELPELDAEPLERMLEEIEKAEKGLENHGKE